VRGLGCQLKQDIIANTLKQALEEKHKLLLTAATARRRLRPSREIRERRRLRLQYDYDEETKARTDMD
jgi:hypothetical protein